VGVAVQHVTTHGLALNVDPNMMHFDSSYGVADHRGVTSMRAMLVVSRNGSCQRSFARLVTCYEVAPHQRRGWLVAGSRKRRRVEQLVTDLGLHTVCQEAACPNIGECWSRGTATFMLLGDICTRHCRFCNVTPGRPLPPDPNEPMRVAQAAARLGLHHVVLTSVTRDDLSDGGASQFALTIRAIRRRLPGATVEALVPDFNGSLTALGVVADARPDVFNHNVETVERLSNRVRAKAEYRRSLAVLAWATYGTTKSADGRPGQTRRSDQTRAICAAPVATS
jgi:lipoate synthase